MNDLRAGERYRVSTEHTFEGVFEEIVERGNPPKRYAVFATDSAAGIPHEGSGRRYVPEGAVLRLEHRESDA